MSDNRQDEIEKAARDIRKLVEALEGEGFSREEAVAIAAGALNSISHYPA